MNHKIQLNEKELRKILNIDEYQNKYTGETHMVFRQLDNPRDLPNIGVEEIKDD